MNVLIPQCGTVGVNSTVSLSEWFESKVICGAETTASCSNDMLLCSGSEIDLMRSTTTLVSATARRISGREGELTEDFVLVYRFHFGGLVVCFALII